MSDAPRLLALQLREALVLLERYLAGFDDANRTRQAPGLPNHAAWTLGHLALVLNRAAERLGADGELPASDFLVADPDGQRYGTETVAFGSSPADDPTMYPAWARCREILGTAVERAARAVERLTDGQLAEDVPWWPTPIGRRSLVTRQVFHLGTHCGQIADLRRALGMPSVIRR